MADDNSPEFKFEADEQDPETFYHEEIRDLRVEKLSHRITLLSILLPCLIGVAIFFAYRDITGRVHRTQDTGSLEVQRLKGELEEISKKFNDKLITFSTTLSTQDKDFDKTISGKLSAINKNIDALNKNLKTLNENLSQTRTTVKNLAGSKADKKKQDAAFAKINAALKTSKKELQSLAALRQELTAVSSGIKDLEKKLDQKITRVAAAAEQTNKDYSKLQTSIASLSGDKIDKDTFDLEVFKLKKNYQNLLAQEMEALNQKLDSIQKKVDEFQKTSRSQKRSMKSLSKKTSSAPDKTTTPAKSGSIEEQDLTE
jgi:DNA repair exonuclease SbcCD ATPase subunit